jgi:tRNA(Arg) A34 adenosine deaminase TadA
MTSPEIRISLPDWIDDVVDVRRTYPDDRDRIRVAITLARENVRRRTGGPFGAAIFERETGRLIGMGTNSAVRCTNSTLHAEMVAFMMAQARVGRFTLGGPGMPTHDLYSSCEPCAMCLGGVLWSGVSRVIHAARRNDARQLSFDEGPVFPESYTYMAERGINVVRDICRDEALAVFDEYLAAGGAIYNG